MHYLKQDALEYLEFAETLAPRTNARPEFARIHQGFFKLLEKEGYSSELIARCRSRVRYSKGLGSGEPFPL